MASVITTQSGATADSTVEFTPTIGHNKSGIFQATNVSTDSSSAVCTITLSGKLSADHEYHTIKAFALTSANTTTPVTNAAVVTLFPFMKVFADKSSGNVSMSASVLI